MKIVYRQRRPVAFIAIVLAGIVPESKLRNRMEERRTLIRLFPLLAVRLLWSHHVAVVADAVWWLAVGGALCSARIAESRLRMMPGSANSAGPRFLMKGLRRMLTTSRAGKRGIPSPRRHRRRRMWGANQGFRSAMAQGAASRSKGISPQVATVAAVCAVLIIAVAVFAIPRIIEAAGGSSSETASRQQADQQAHQQSDGA